MDWEDDYEEKFNSIVEDWYYSRSDADEQVKALGLKCLVDASKAAIGTMYEEGKEELVLRGLSIGRQLAPEKMIQLKRRYEDPIRTTFFNVIVDNAPVVQGLISSMINSFLTKFPSLVNSVDEDGWTPLHAACYTGSYVSVDELCKFNHLINAPEQSSSHTPLHLAIIGLCLKCCSKYTPPSFNFLLAEDQPTNPANMLRYRSTITSLLKHGSAILTNDKGASAIDYVNDKDDFPGDIADMLRQRCAEQVACCAYASCNRKMSDPSPSPSLSLSPVPDLKPPEEEQKLLRCSR